MSSGPDVRRLTPADAVAALRSFPRRFRTLLAWPEDEPRPDWFDAVAGEVAAAARELAVDATVVVAALTGTGGSPGPPPPGIDGAEAALDLLALESAALADRVERVPAHEWHDAPEALDRLREAVRRAAAHLHAAQQRRVRMV